MRTARKAVSKGAISAAAVMIVISVIFTTLSIEVGGSTIVDAFQGATDKSHTEWIEQKIGANAQTMCDSGDDMQAPISGYYERKFPNAEEVGTTSESFFKIFQVKDGSGNILGEGIIDYASGSSQEICTTIDFNGSAPSSLDANKPLRLRLYSDSTDSVTVEITHP